MDRNYLRFVTSVGLVAAGFAVLMLIMSSSAIADVDLVISSTDITFEVDGQTDNSPSENDQVDIIAVVTNDGTDTNATNFYVKFLDGIAEIDSVLVSSNVTYGGGSVNVTTSWTASVPGSHTMSVEVDSTTVIAESNETNNSASKNLKVNIDPHVVANVDMTVNETLINFAFNASGSDDEDGNIVSYFWAFGDGNFAATNGTTHAYGDDGVYTVTLLITDNDGGTNSTTLQVTVLNRDPIARAIDQSGSTYDLIWLDSANSSDADGSIKNITWFFQSDNVYRYGKKVVYTYTDDGTYTVTMTVTDDDGATDVLDLYITINNRAPNPSLLSNRTKINTTESIFFNGSASWDKDGSVVNFTWILPNAVNRYGPTLSYQFNLANGSYLVTLIVTDDDGAIGFKSINIKVGNKAPVLDPGLDTIADTYENIKFDGSASYDPDGYIVNYTWDMGDGKKFYNETFLYFYKDDGVYTVRLTIIDDEGASNTSTIKATILNQGPVAFHSPTSIHTYSPYVFNTSQCQDVDGYIASVQWVFEDPGNSFTNVNGNTSYQWNQNGTYSVQMTITDDDGATDNYSFNVTVMNSHPWAIFSFSPTTGISVGDDVTFDASSSVDLDGSITNWTWFFGESPSSIGYGEMVTYQYQKSGSYIVELLVIDNNGGSNSSQKSIFVAAKNDRPIPSFEVTASEFMTNRNINFDASASIDPDGTIVKYMWDMGDGRSQSFGQSLTYRFTQEGTFKVVLEVEDNGGKTNSTSQNVTITLAPNLPPIATIEASASEITAGEKIILDGRGSHDDDGYITAFSWDFGDGTTKNASYVSKTYSSTDVGVKTIVLTVTDNSNKPNGVTTASIQVTLLAPPKKNIMPIAAFSFTPPEPITTGQDISFNAGSSQDPDGTITGWTWLFGDGSFAEGKTVTHSYNDNRVYQVILTVIDSDGGSGTISKEITITNTAPEAVISAEKEAVQTLEKIKFSAAGSHDDDGQITSYTWVFGDEKVTKTGVEVSHAFSSRGNQKVTLKILDNDGSTGVAEITIKVDNRAPEAIVGGDKVVLEDQPFDLDGSGSKDLDGTITTYTWNLGDNREVNGLNPSVTYPTIAADETQVVFRCTLIVVDDAGAISDAATFNITVLKKPKPPKKVPRSSFIPGFDALLVVATMAIAVTLIMGRHGRKR